jgi:hypothetical protein
MEIDSSGGQVSREPVSKGNVHIIYIIKNNSVNKNATIIDGYATLWHYWMEFNDRKERRIA